jgi:hypothetical protein
MRHTITWFALVLTLLAPGIALARAPQADTNVNTRYKVASVTVTGVDEAKISQPLRDDIQKLVGNRYDPDATDDLADRLRKELHGFTVNVKVKRGDEPDSVTVVFEAERAQRPRRFDVRLAPLLYSTTDGFSAAIVPGFETHHNVISFGFVSSADELLERNIGILLRYEHHKVGTSKVGVGIEYDYFHPSFEPETEAALLLEPQVPGIYRTRENFAPSISFLPIPDIKLTFGASFQTLEMQYPAPYDQAANAFTFGAQLRHEVRPRHGLRHAIGADYTVRAATSSLESDLVYTRQWVASDYTITVGRQLFGFHFQGGHTSGTPPLFERFSLGNTMTLRGWDKFDVAPIGGTRLAYGSLEYRYRPIHIFYDVGAVWDAGQTAEVKHAMGIGLGWKNGFFASLGFPLRYHDVTPVFMIGFRR